MSPLEFAVQINGFICRVEEVQKSYAKIIGKEYFERLIDSLKQAASTLAFEGDQDQMADMKTNTAFVNALKAMYVAIDSNPNTPRKERVSCGPLESINSDFLQLRERCEFIFRHLDIDPKNLPFTLDQIILRSKGYRYRDALVPSGLGRLKEYLGESAGGVAVHGKPPPDSGGTFACRKLVVLEDALDVRKKIARLHIPIMGEEIDWRAQSRSINLNLDKINSGNMEI